ncbi:hypothetical protein QBC39DRAFT_356763 [Podospora conica]|nr:hypothetical protein QBC39DRAFT_356763 [Schizothecium conicum]
MILSLALYGLVGLSAVAADFSVNCDNIHVPEGSFTLQASCHDPGQDAGYDVDKDLSECVGVDFKTDELIWKYFGLAGDYCTNCKATEQTFGETILTCTCASDGSGPNSPTAVTSELILDSYLDLANGSLNCDHLAKGDPDAVRGLTIAARGFSPACTDLRLSQGEGMGNLTLEAICSDFDNFRGFYNGTLDLNQCIGVEDNQLVWRKNGLAADFCDGCKIDGAETGLGSVDLGQYTLTCICSSSDGDTISSSARSSQLLLDAYIDLENHVLNCDRVTDTPTGNPAPAPHGVPTPNIQGSGPHRISSRDGKTPKTGNFTTDCIDVTLDHRNVLHASCFGGRTVEAGEPNTELDLNLCVGFHHESKSLQWLSDGKFETICKDCMVADYGPAKIMGCFCDGSDPENLSLLDLDEGIKNEKGKLACA